MNFIRVGCARSIRNGEYMLQNIVSMSEFTDYRLVLGIERGEGSLLWWPLMEDHVRFPALAHLRVSVCGGTARLAGRLWGYNPN